MYKMRFFFAFWVLFWGISGTAQSVLISGKVMDSLLQKPLAGASVVFYNASGKKLNLVTTDENGSFSIQTGAGSIQSASISYIGYQEKKISFTYKNLVKEYNLGSLFLYPQGSSLSEVVIVGKRRPPVSFKVDRQVYKAAQFGNAANGNGVDVLRNLPSVSLNGQGTLSLRGSTSFLVLLNGKPTQGDPSFVLSQLSASSIESVEVITSPSAAYDADGKSGLINIITKASTEDGWVVQVNAMGGLPPLHDFDNRREPQRRGLDLSAGYRRNSWDINGGLNYLRNDISGYREGDVYTIINNVKTSFPSNGERSFKRYNYGGRLAATFQANTRNTFSAGFYVGKKFQSRVADILYNNTHENLLTGDKQAFTYFNANTQEKEGVFTLANLEYAHQFADKSKLTLAALYERAALSGTTYNANMVHPGLKDTLQYTVNPNSNPLNAYRIKSDYQKKIGQGQLQAGYQYRYDVQDGQFLYLTQVPGTQDLITDAEFTSQVRAINHIHAVYCQYSGQAGRLHYSAGLRAEQSTRLLSFSKNEEEQSLHLFNLFTSIQLRYASWTKGGLKAGYSRRIKRTNNYELNPFPEREHSETLEQGDPNLLPELSGTWEVGVEQQFTNGNFYATLYYQRVDNPIQRVNKVYNDTILNRVFTNAGRATQLGLESNATFQVNKVWQVVLGGTVYKYKIKGNIFNGVIPIANQSWMYSFNTTQSFSLPRNWMMQLNVNYLSARATAQGEDSRFFTPHFTIKKNSRDRRWTFQGQWLYMDAGLKQANRQRITTYGSDFYTTTNYIYEPDQIQFSIGFNLAKKNRKITLPQSEMGEKEF